MAKLMNVFSSKENRVNPLVVSANVSAVRTLPTDFFGSEYFVPNMSL